MQASRHADSIKHIYIHIFILKIIHAFLPAGVPDLAALCLMSHWIEILLVAWPTGRSRPRDVEEILAAVHRQYPLCEDTLKNVGYVKWLAGLYHILMPDTGTHSHINIYIYKSKKMASRSSVAHLGSPCSHCS